jgi:hypothetical protein
VVNLSDKSKQLIGNENSIKRCLRRIRSNIYPKISKIDKISLEGIRWSMTGKENLESFLFYDNKNSENRIIIFASQKCIDVLKRNKIIIWMEHFLLVPPNFIKFIYYTQV